MRKAQIRETLLYIWFGICTTAINFIVFYLCHVILGIELIASNSIAWIFAVLFAFVTNRGIVFQSKGNLTRQAVSFFTSRVLSLLMENVLLFLLSRMPFAIMLSKLFVSGAVLLFNYIAAKIFVFKEHKEMIV